MSIIAAVPLVVAIGKGIADLAMYIRERRQARRRRERERRAEMAKKKKKGGKC